MAMNKLLPVSRRQLLALGGGWLLGAQALAQYDDGRNLPRFNRALKTLLGVESDQLERSALVQLVVPAIAEAGAQVPMSVTSPLAPAQVVALHVFADRNPEPHVFSAEFGPAAQVTHMATRIRIHETAPVRAVLQLSDGRYLWAYQPVAVVVSGCGEYLFNPKEWDIPLD